MITRGMNQFEILKLLYDGEKFLRIKYKNIKREIMMRGIKDKNIKFPYISVQFDKIKNTPYMYLISAKSKAEMKNGDMRGNVYSFMDTDDGIFTFTDSHFTDEEGKDFDTIDVLYPHALRRWKERMGIECKDWNDTIKRYFKRNGCQVQYDTYYGDLRKTKFNVKYDDENFMCDVIRFIPDGVLLGQLDVGWNQRYKTFIPITYLFKEQLNKFYELMHGKTFNLPFNEGTVTY